MDRKKEETGESTKQTPLISSITPKTIQATNILTTTTGDDTSTEFFDNFDSWTLVNDKENDQFRDNLVDDSENRIEILKNSDDDEEDHKEVENKTEQEPQLPDSSNDAINDDLSDGISIISETESVGRITPHPYVRDHLHDLNLKFYLSDRMDDTILNQLREEMANETVPLLMQQTPDPTTDQQLRQRRRSSTASAVPDNKALQNASHTVTLTSGLVPLVKCDLKIIFYVGVGLALLCLIGRIVNPSWQPLSSVVNSSPFTHQLEQKVNDIELQNNLMRAEIDLLNKQVKYLSSLNEPQHQKSGKYKDHKERKTFKAWSGNGDSLKPIDITKQDLKKPYKCPDGSFVEIANMCMEQRPANEPSIADQFGQVVQDLKEQSEAFKAFEQMAEELQAFQESPFEQLKDVLNEHINTGTPTKHFANSKSINDNQKYRPKTDDSNIHAPQKHDENEGKTDDNYKLNKEHKQFFGKDDNRQSKEYKKYLDQGNSRNNSKDRNEWKENRFGNKERNYRNDTSKERYTKDLHDLKENSKENKSNERYNKQKRKYDKKNDDDDVIGEWQEKYMKHREQQRKQNQQKYQNNKNWYIKRGDSRENKRSGEYQYRWKNHIISSA